MPNNHSFSKICQQPITSSFGTMVQNPYSNHMMDRFQCSSKQNSPCTNSWKKHKRLNRPNQTCISFGWTRQNCARDTNPKFKKKRRMQQNHFQLRFDQEDVSDFLTTSNTQIVSSPLAGGCCGGIATVTRATSCALSARAPASVSTRSPARVRAAAPRRTWINFYSHARRNRQHS